MHIIIYKKNIIYNNIILQKFKVTTLTEYLNENIQESNLILYHGSNNYKIYDNFFNDQFYTVNDYIASNYAYNFGGLMYKVKVKSLNCFELKGNYVMLGGRNMSTQEPERYKLEYDLIENLYGNDALELWLNRGFQPSPSSIFGEKGWGPIIDWCKKNRYDSIKFYDESFDVFVRDITYIIFDGTKPKILNIYDVKDAFESNFSKKYTKIKK